MLEQYTKIVTLHILKIAKAIAPEDKISKSAIPHYQINIKKKVYLKKNIVILASNQVNFVCE